jgi:hypothetical protein
MSSWLSAGVVAMALMVPALADAGARLSFPVSVNVQNKSAHGSLGTARASSDTRQELGCYLHASKTGNAGNWQTGHCLAVDANGVQYGCYFREDAPTLVQAVQAVSSDSYVKFRAVVGNTCHEVMVSNTSAAEPK